MTCRNDPEIRRQWGCDGDSEDDPEWGAGSSYNLGGYITRRCPLALMNAPQPRAVIKAHSLYQRGFMPEEGGWKKQTNLYLECMTLVDQLKDDAKGWFLEAKAALKESEDE